MNVMAANQDPKFRTPLYYEDLAVGQIYRTGSITLDAEAIKAFAASFDPQPFHLDEAAAANTFFYGLAASGWHTAAITMRLIVTEGAPIAGGSIGAGVEELRWPRPVRPGDRLRLESEVMEMRTMKSRPQYGLVKIQTTTLNQNDEPVQIMTSNMIVPKRDW
jgi:acyl dehydratase